MRHKITGESDDETGKLANTEIPFKKISIVWTKDTLMCTLHLKVLR